MNNLETQCEFKTKSIRLDKLLRRGSTGLVELYIKGYKERGCYDCSGQEDTKTKCFFYRTK